MEPDTDTPTDTDVRDTDHADHTDTPVAPPADTDAKGPSDTDRLADTDGATVQIEAPAPEPFLTPVFVALSAGVAGMVGFALARWVFRPIARTAEDRIAAESRELAALQEAIKEAAHRDELRSVAAEVRSIATSIRSVESRIDALREKVVEVGGAVNTLDAKVKEIAAPQAKPKPKAKKPTAT